MDIPNVSHALPVVAQEVGLARTREVLLLLQVGIEGGGKSGLRHGALQIQLIVGRWEDVRTQEMQGPEN